MWVFLGCAIATAGAQAGTTDRPWCRKIQTLQKQELGNLISQDKCVIGVLRPPPPPLKELGQLWKLAQSGPELLKLLFMKGINTFLFCIKSWMGNIGSGKIQFFSYRTDESRARSRFCHISSGRRSSVLRNARLILWESRIYQVLQSSKRKVSNVFPQVAAGLSEKVPQGVQSLNTMSIPGEIT